jgi:hypothetical protein
MGICRDGRGRGGRVLAVLMGEWLPGRSRGGSEHETRRRDRP